MPDTSQIQGSHLLIGAIAALLTAILVPVQGIIKSYLDAKSGRAPETMTERQLLAEIAEGVRDIALAIRERTAADDAHERDRLAERIDRLREEMHDRRPGRGGYPVS